MTILAGSKARECEPDEFSGIIGLSPVMKDTGEHKNLDQFVNRLAFVSGGKKVAPVFSFFLSNENAKLASVQIGGWNLDKYAKKGLTEKDIRWH